MRESPLLTELGTGVLESVRASMHGPSTYEAHVVLRNCAAPVAIPITEAKARELGPHVGRLIEVTLTAPRTIAAAGERADHADREQSAGVTTRAAEGT